MSLYNHSSNINPYMDIRAPPSKFPRADMGPYPGGVPEVTDRYISPAGRVNNTPGLRTNGSVRANVISKTLNQQYVNANQFAWMDVSKHNHPHLLNLQQLNHYLASKEFEDKLKSLSLRDFSATLDTRSRIKESQKSRFYQIHNEKSYILKRFKLFGVVSNLDINDPSLFSHTPMQSNPRAVTMTVHGVCYVLDYWSKKSNRLKAYDTCYFVLKKIDIDEDTKYQSLISSTTVDTGITNDLRKKTKVWQVVPVHNSLSSLPVKEYSWENKNKVTEFGTYWKVGHIHEYPDLGHPSLFEKRNDFTVSRDMSSLHGNGRIKPIHFYLNMDSTKLI